MIQPSRALVAVAAFWVLAACSGSPPPVEDGRATPSPTATRTATGVEPLPAAFRPFVKVACDLPRPWLLRIWRGYREGRSGEVQFVPKVPNIVGTGLPHVGPWDFTERVPMFWYGPGHIRAAGKIGRPVTSADIAATEAALLGFDFPAPDGHPMREALLPPGERPGPPRLIVTVVWDGAGRNVLAEWPDDWPNLRRLIPKGTWFDHATVGSSPTSSAQIHATIGTGGFPRRHGLVGHSIRIGGRIVPPWRDGPSLLLLPTLADLYDRAMGNRPVVAAVGTAAIQLGFLGHGAALQGGDRDIAVLREARRQTEGLAQEGSEWNLGPSLRRFYRFPEYANDLPGIERYVRELDSSDGARDGTWRGHSFDEDALLGGFQTPARIPYQTRLLEEIIRREGLGTDDTPDLLFVNYKIIDYVGHVWTLNAPEMKDSVHTQDRNLPLLIRALDRSVGRGRWVLLVTADHGSTPDPEITGAFRISFAGLHQAINGLDRDGDDVPVAESVKPTEAFVNVEELRENGATLADVANRLMELTQSETAIPGQPVPDPGAAPIQAAFPSVVLDHLRCLPGT